MRSVGTGGQRRTVAPLPTTTGPAPLALTNTWATFAKRWKAENEHLLSESYLRAANQVVGALAEFDPKLRLATLTREQLAKYTACGTRFSQCS